MNYIAIVIYIVRIFNLSPNLYTSGRENADFRTISRGMVEQLKPPILTDP